MTTFEKLSEKYSEITLQNLSEKSHEELLTMLLKIIQSGEVTGNFLLAGNSEFNIPSDILADILRGREI